MREHVLSPASPLPVPARSRWRELACSASLAVLVDLDGTLIDFAPSPAQAVLDPEAIQLLAALTDAGVQVVVVSGRRSAEIAEMRALVPNIWWVAEHGSWRWDRDTCVRPPASAPELDGLTAKLAAHTAVPGVLIERKTLSLCVHWRRVAPGERQALIGALELACDEWLEEHPGYERLDGVEVIEIRLRGVHKGGAVRWVRERMASPAIIAIGDDVTDQDMFVEIDDRGASVCVGPRAPALRADAEAADVRAVRGFLRWIVETRQGRDLPLPISPRDGEPELARYQLVVLSNRTPARAEGRAREVGGLVSALEPALRDEHGIWLGWSGQERAHDTGLTIDAQTRPARASFDLQPAVRQRFYAGFCNSVLWPLFHGFPARVRYSDGDWEAYVRANERYARHALELAQPDATIWVHDYHLLLAARAMRAQGHRGRIGLFLHIPFPSREVLETIPWAAQLVDAMLDFDLLGFQTAHSVDNFLASARLVRQALCDERSVRRPERVTSLGVFPAAIDPAPFRAAGPEVPEVAGLRKALAGRRLLLGVDRLDYSKGIPERLEAYERMLDRYPEWRTRVVLVQISVPTRADIPEYAELRHRVEALVGRINGRFGETDWVPVRYLYRSYDHAVLAQLYRLADIALVTPLRDGMNLVAKEFVAAQDPAHPGVLVLSQYAGAAEALASALITNPFHPERLAADLDLALRMPLSERIQRHRMLLATLERGGDAKAWARSFLDRLAPRRLHAVD